MLTEARWHVFNILVFDSEKNNDLPLGSMFEIENKMVFIIITPSLCKLWASVRAPAFKMCPPVTGREKGGTC